MTPLRLIDIQGRPFTLGPLLTDGAGGEGSVYALPNDPSRVAKIYHAAKLPLDAEQVDRLTFQTSAAASPLLKITGWPTALLLESPTRRPVGFTMPKVEGIAIWKLFQPEERLKFFPKATWAFQARAAVNLAAVFDEVHKLGYVVGDVSLKNVFVTHQATVKLIDCDSFQVRTPKHVIPCRVGTPEYVPPELQRQRLGERTENHDRFGLAVLIYQLLFLSSHPYCGIDRGSGDPTLEDNIRDYRFSQGPAAHSWQMSPPPLTPTFADIPPELGNLFRRAFERGSQNGSRPTALEWNRALQSLESTTITCMADSGHKYWKGAAGCVWCRLAKNGGPEYYYGAAESGGPFALNEARLTEVRRRLQAAALLAFSFNRRQLEPSTRPTGKPVPATILDLKTRRANESQDEKELPPPVAISLLPRPKLEPEIEEDISIPHHESSPEEERDRRLITITLASCTAFGFLLIPFGVYRTWISAIGFFTTILFGTFLAIHLKTTQYTQSKKLQFIRRQILRQRSEADRKNDEIRRKNRRRLKEWKHRNAEIRVTNDDRRRIWEWKNAEIRERNKQARLKHQRAYMVALEAERDRRSEEMRKAEARVSELEHSWSDRVAAYANRHRELVALIDRATNDCRGLDPLYHAEIQRLTANAEAAARRRHLQFHSLAAATIPDIGPKRKQILADRGINTAADVEENAIRRIDGFGDKRTGYLLEWKAGILARFRFDPRSVEGSPEHNTAALRFGGQQKSLLDGCEHVLQELNSLAPACRTAIQQIEGLLRTEFQRLAQSRANVDIVTRLIDAE